MSEHIYTIPVNEAFDRERITDNRETIAVSEGKEAPRCPFCRLYDQLEQDELELVLGGAMMEPDVRIKTNELGFCHHHLMMLTKRKNRLGLALILESHLNEKRELFGKNGISAALKGKGTADMEEAQKMGCSCYLCRRIDEKFSHMIRNAAMLWEEDGEFRKKVKDQPFFCMPHYGMLLAAGKAEISKKKFPDFYDDVSGVMLRYFDELRGDVSWFCKKFDYRYEAEPWGNAKDAVERASVFLTGEAGEK